MKGRTLGTRKSWTEKISEAVVVFLCPLKFDLNHNKLLIFPSLTQLR